jgi:hypothetical protein
MLAAYIPAILAHYRFCFGRGRTGLRINPEPAEGVIVTVAFILAVVVFALVLQDVL